MAKKAPVTLIRLVSTEGTGFFYVAKENPRNIIRKNVFQEVRSCCTEACRI